MISANVKSGSGREEGRVSEESQKKKVETKCESGLGQVKCALFGFLEGRGVG